MNNLPAITLVHGFWGGAAHWSKAILELERPDHDSLHAVELPSTLLADDAERTRKMIAQQQRPVLLVRHSYGGAVITGAGNQPDVVGLVYIVAFAPDSGEGPSGITQEHLPLAAASLAPDSDGYLWVKADRLHESFRQDLVVGEGLVVGITQKTPLASTFGDAIGSLAWKGKPSWYQISSADRIIAPENQKQAAAWIALREIITLNASHTSLTSRAKEVAALIDEATVATAHWRHAGRGDRPGLLPRRAQRPRTDRSGRPSTMGGHQK